MAVQKDGRNRGLASRWVTKDSGYQLCCFPSFLLWFETVSLQARLELTILLSLPLGNEIAGMYHYAQPLAFVNSIWLGL